MVEHLVYTESVGGSNPSPPTSVGRWASLLRRMIIVGAALFAAGAPLTKASAADMSFRLATLSGGLCGSRCPQAIVANGVIEESTPDAFVAFAKSASLDGRLRGMILLNSPGGRVVAAMRLGQIFRQLHVSIAVAGYEEVGQRAGPTTGHCMSACVYLMMGGVKRVVPPDSQVGIHRMSATGYGDAQAHTSASPSIAYADENMVNSLARYAAQMGVSPTLIRTAETIAPEDIRILTAAEMRNWRLSTAHF